MKLDTATLVLPAVLAVTTFAAVACVTTSNDEGTEAVADSGETGEADCYTITDMSACEADATCNWDPDFDGCLPDCTLYASQDACTAVDGCGWDSIEGCLGPFV